MDEQQNIIIYRTADGKSSVALYAKDGKIWLNQQQMAELFATSKPNISMHVANILKEKELYKDSVVKEFLTTAADGKNYNVVFYSLEMMFAADTTPLMPSANSLMPRWPMPRTSKCWKTWRKALLRNRKETNKKKSLWISMQFILMN